MAAFTLFNSGPFSPKQIGSFTVPIEKTIWPPNPTSNWLMGERSSRLLLSCFRHPYVIMLAELPLYIRTLFTRELAAFISTTRGLSCDTCIALAVSSPKTICGAFPSAKGVPTSRIWPLSDREWLLRARPNVPPDANLPDMTFTHASVCVPLWASWSSWRLYKGFLRYRVSFPSSASLSSALFNSR